LSRIGAEGELRSLNILRGARSESKPQRWAGWFDCSGCG